jgi:putative PIG3 family NAD(P)H quinone oxidoreductase
MSPLPAAMRAILFDGTGGPEVLHLAEWPVPAPAAGEVLIKIAATALNLADVRQRQGAYIMSAGPRVLGLECSGHIAALGEGVEGWQIGQPVCALLGRGGYAEYATAPASQLLAVPEGMDLASAAALPEAAATIWSNIFDIGGLREGGTLLVQGGAGGIGSLALQFGKAMGARVFCTASNARREFCESLGAERSFDYRDNGTVDAFLAATDGYGADVILDNMGASHLARNIDCLALDGRIMSIGLQGGRVAEINLALLMKKRGSLCSTSLSDRSPAAKARIMEGVRTQLWPHVLAGRVRPVIDQSFALAEAAEAHRAMEAGGRSGKLLLRCAS